MEVITTHVNADFDAMASMIAAKKLYPDAVLVFPGSQERTLRNFFVNSTMYLYDFRRIRDLDLDQVRRLIIVDTRQVSRIGRFDTLVGRDGVEIIIYDHHPDAADDIRADRITWKPVGACVTILTEIIRERRIELLPEEATILSLGLFEDTGSFTFNSTTPEDFEAAAYLRRCGADLNVIADIISQELTPEQVTVLNEMIHTAKTMNIHGIDVCVVSISLPKYLGDFALLVHKFKDIHNLDVVFALARMDDRIYLVGRSRIPEVNAGLIASHFDGGGHATAASASIKDLTLVQAENRLVEVLRSCINPFPTAEHLMTSPAITVDINATIGEAEELMVKYNINSMPVLEDGKVAGVINRQFLEKAIFHGLQKQSMREFLNPDFAIVQPGATLLEIQTYLVEHQQRILPVVQDGTLVGVITRRDLLNFLVSDQSVTPRPLYGERDEAQSQAHWPKRKNVTGALKEQLTRPIIDRLKRFGDHAERLHFKAYIVGGFVRDLLLRRPNLDIDLVVEGDAIEFARTFAQQHDVRTRSHKKFNTAMIFFPDGLRVDVATARYEYYQHPAALPIVEAGSLKLDLYRRDFTINTLAVGLNPDQFGHLIDFFGGQRDLKDKSIRVLHNLSFVEDPTRILRALRFEQRFGFRIGKQTTALIRNAIRMGLLQKLGGYRLFHEVQLILMEDDPVPVLRGMDEHGVLAVFSPKMRFDLKMEDLFDRMKEVITWHELSFLGEPLEPWWVYFLGLMTKLPREDLTEAAARLELTDAMRERLQWVRNRAEEVLWGLFQLPDYRPSDIYRALQPFKAEELLFLMARTQREETRKAISHYLIRYREMKSEIRGQDLKDLGIPPGPVYRKILEEILDGRLNGEIKSRQDEMDHILRHYPGFIKMAPDGRIPVPAE
ncbi:MAG: CBS domain-containing protein [Syntrophobacteraceae bacterium]